MGDIRHHSQAILTIGEQQVQLVDKISETKLSEIVTANVEDNMALCSLHTWYSKHAGNFGGAGREYPCEITYDTVREGQGTARVTLECGKMACRGEDAVIKTAEAIDKSVNQASKEISRLIS